MTRLALKASALTFASPPADCRRHNCGRTQGPAAVRLQTRIVRALSFLAGRIFRPRTRRRLRACPRRSLWPRARR